MERPISLEIYETMKKLIPGGVNSPIRSFPGLGVHPLIASHGKGSSLYDMDGHRYIDFCMSWGSLLLGHCPPAVIKAVEEQIRKGSSFGLSTQVEEKMAHQVIKMLPWIHMIRFVSSGTEATMSALRLARGATGRKKIVKFIGNYHGHADHLMVKAGSYLNLIDNQPSTMGIPKEIVQHTISLPYNDIEALEDFIKSYPEKEDIAGIILEPVAGNIGVIPASFSFIQRLRAFTHEIGAALIFDEVITGFRVGKQGAASLYQIEPDIVCLGKIIGGGYPAAAFGGKKEFMKHLAPLGSVFQAGTLSGNPVAMAAGLATLRAIDQKGFYELLEHKMKLFLNPLEDFIKQNDLPVALNRQGAMFTLFFGIKQVTTSHDVARIDSGLFQKFFIHLLQNGIYFSPSSYEASFISAEHSEEELLYTSQIIKDFLYKELL